MPRTLLNNRVKAVMENEWAQLAASKVVVFTTIGPPLLLVLLGLVMIGLSAVIDSDGSAVNSAVSAISQGTVLLSPGAAIGSKSITEALLNPFLLVFQLIPLIVPMTIASYSIVGEKQSRSLEALLAAPIRTWELLLAKSLAAAIPGILATWYSFALFIFAAQFTLSDPLLHKIVLSPTWVLTVVFLTPLFTFLAVGTGIIISSRVREPSTAQQLGSLLVMPMIGLLIAQILGAVDISVSIVLSAAVALAIVDIILLAVAVRLFRREQILTHWK